MNNILKCCRENNIKIKRIEYINNLIIIYGDNHNYLLDNSNNKELFEYFEKVGFHNYLHKINNKSDSYSLYIYNTDTSDNNKKVNELINVISSLHLKTLHYTKINEEEFEKLYNNIKEKIDLNIKYYLDLQDYIEEYPFLRVDHLFLIKNISMIYKILSLSKENLDKWYNKKKQTIRKSYIVGENNTLNNFRVSSGSYFINYDSCHDDILIYDLVNFYKNDALNVDFFKAFNLYKEKILLEKEEIYLFKSLICIPKKLTLSKDMYENTIKINNLLDYISKTVSFILEKDEENQKTNK